MATRPQPLARLAAGERRVIALLRGAAGEAVEDRQSSFPRLRRAAIASGFDILSQDASFASNDELRLLRGMALSQRRRHSASDQLSDEIRDLVYACASELDAAGVHLSYGTACPEARAPRPGARTIPRGCTTVSPDRSHLLRKQVLELAEIKGVMMTQDFVRLGISRQYLSLLCKRGVLVRVRVGAYASARMASGQT